MRKLILALVLFISTISLFAQKVLPERVPDNPDVYAEDKPAYDQGYRLGKMYALRDDVGNYQWACDNAANLRNQNPSEQAYYENQLLGLVAGWMENRLPLSTTTYQNVKSLMRQSHTYKWTVSWNPNYGFSIARYWLP